MNITEQLARLVKPLSDRVRMMIARAVIDAVNDSSNVQQMKIKLLAGEMSDKVERFQNYGFTSHPHPGMEAAAVFINGERSNPLILAVGDRLYRIKEMQQGEVAIYTDEGDKIHLKRGNNIDVECGGTLTMSAKSIIMNADSVTTNASTVETSASTVTTTASSTTINAADNSITGNLVVAGAIAWGISASGMNGEPAKFGANGVTSEGEVTASGVALSKHTHSCREGGTGGPQ